ncbi:MAG: adenylosuccinate lyase [Verrucomicrobiota bacterium]|jgi:adenylosuccinate lyase|nr:adenylosuccinate lyase [Verrucomicrobiota bacterium]MDD8050173.1 adenylosuccinate lyase [Verrucomicrobiota bacterium]
MIERYSLSPMRDLWTDQARFETWLKVEVLACEAMATLGQVPADALAEIKQRARFDVDRIHEIEATTHHDVVAFITCVAENIGPAGRFVHMGLTSSDVVDTALAYNMRQAAEILIEDVRRLREVVGRRAKEFKRVPMMGRTHGVHAEPTTFGLKLALMYDEFGRALERLERARSVISVGALSGAVGTHANIEPLVEEHVCENLGLRPANISTQILQRDRHAEYMSALAVVASSVERWAQEFRHLHRTEVREAEEPFAKGQKGSSAMPHKRNPIICERLCGLARVIRGYAVTALENVALWHERDISHSSSERVIIPDGTVLLDYMLHKLLWLVDGLVVNPDRMLANLEMSHGLIFSQQVMLAMARKGLPRQDAYVIVQRNAMESWNTGRSFKELLMADPEIQEHFSADELDQIFDLEFHFRAVDSIFQRVGLED